jgi:diguanylate cyclase
MAELTPKDIAREAIRLIAVRKLVPTPDNYRTTYHEVAGTRALQPFPYESWLQIVSALPSATPAQQRLKRQVGHAVSKHDWIGLQRALVDNLKLMLPAAPEGPGPGATPLHPEPSEPVLAADLMEQMARIVGHALPGVGNDDSRLIEQANELVDYLRLPDQQPAALRRLMADFAFRLSFVAEEQGLIRSSLLALLQLVLDHVGQLSPDNPWLKGQMEALVKAAAPPLSVRRLEALERQLRDVIQKQGEASARTVEAREVMKVALSRFIGRLGEMGDQGHHYQARIEDFAARLENATDEAALAPILQEAIQATRTMVLDTRRATDEMQALRQRSEQAQEEIERLQQEIDRLSAAARVDLLTGALNRRGLEEVVARELARAERTGGKVCLALLDIDDFKRLNDTHGHDAGDAALRHLADVARSALRPSDSLARHGGEEFVIVLPEASLDEAAEIVRRLQRELTKNCFLQGDQRLLITFSAGVTEVGPQEDHAQALRRADEAMYVAKRSGKNRVVGS